MVQLPALIEEPAASQQSAEQQNAQEGEQALRYKTKETMKHRKTPLMIKKNATIINDLQGVCKEQL